MRSDEMVPIAQQIEGDHRRDEQQRQQIGESHAAADDADQCSTDPADDSADLGRDAVAQIGQAADAKPLGKDLDLRQQAVRSAIHITRQPPGEIEQLTLQQRHQHQQCHDDDGTQSRC